ncbi:MAG: hypothetical protein RI900_2032 [Actinomycetota bacterium]
MVTAVGETAGYAGDRTKTAVMPCVQVLAGGTAWFCRNVSRMYWARQHAHEFKKI